jgi:hypothetical protein
MIIEIVIEIIMQTDKIDEEIISKCDKAIKNTPKARTRNSGNI